MGIKRRLFISLTTLSLFSIVAAFENCTSSGHSLTLNTSSSNSAASTTTTGTGTLTSAPGASPTPVATATPGPTPTPTPPPDATTLVWAQFTFPIVYYSGVSGCAGVLTTTYASGAACTTANLCQLGVYSVGSPFGGDFAILSMAQACVAYDTVKKCIPATQIPPVVLDPTKEKMNPTVTYPTTQPVLSLLSETLKICP